MRVISDSSEDNDQRARDHWHAHCGALFMSSGSCRLNTHYEKRKDFYVSFQLFRVFHSLHTEDLITPFD